MQTFKLHDGMGETPVMERGKEKEDYPLLLPKKTKASATR